MASNLKCVECKSLFIQPTILPCRHSVCYLCVVGLLRKHTLSRGAAISSDNVEDASDSVSVSSETDSGVFVNGHSHDRNSHRLSNPLPAPPLPLPHNHSPSPSNVKCPVCGLEFVGDEQWAKELPQNYELAERVTAFLTNSTPLAKCQLCADREVPLEATVFCEQCQIYYCSKCKDTSHPNRGPFLTHNVVAAHQWFLTNLRTSCGAGAQGGSGSGSGSAQCSSHLDQSVTYYCLDCTRLICVECLEGEHHSKHDVQAISAATKILKGEISQGLNSLSEKARQAKDMVASFKGSSESLQEDAVSFETRVVCEFDSVIEALQRRKEQLIAELEREKHRKQQVFKKSSQECTQHLRQTTGLIEYCLEVLQESNQLNFLQISGPIIKRVYEADMQWRRKLHEENDESRSFRYKIDCSSVRKLAEELNFCKLDVPSPPLIVTEECYAENNSVSFSWRSHTSTWVDGYILELDDGKSGRFREVYRGKETVCTIDGLHFDTTYRSRVRSFNECGISLYSDVVSLSTSKVAWFTLDAENTHSDIILSNASSTVTSSSFDERVVLGNVGFSKGRHYWEITIDRYDSIPDPAFGVARHDVSKDRMLGKDTKSWALYMDRKRSYFMHNNVHSQGNTGGIGLGSVIGVLMNVDKALLTFFLDGIKVDTFAMHETGGVFFPAISLNRNVQATIHTGLTTPEVS